MKHRIGFNALSRKSSERKALKRNMVTSLFRYERIETTKAKALEVRKMAEKMITRAKVDSVHNRRIIARARASVMTPLEVEQPPRISAFGETRSLSEVVIHLVPRKSKPSVRNTAP